MKKIRIVDATIPQLNWLTTGLEYKRQTYTKQWVWDRHVLGEYDSFVTDWLYGGPIGEREMLMPAPVLDNNCELLGWSCADWKGDGTNYYGATQLEAVIRCYVASKLGDTADVPEKL